MSIQTISLPLPLKLIQTLDYKLGICERFFGMTHFSQVALLFYEA